MTSIFNIPRFWRRHQKVKNTSLHSRSFYICRHSSVFQKLSDQDECNMAHKGGIKCYGGEKAVITKGNSPDPQKRIEITFN